MRFKSQDRAVNLRVPSDVYDKLDHIAEQRWTNISNVIRQGIRKELEANDELFSEEYLNLNRHHQKAY
jgi:predicted transcriptional regulator